MAELEVSTQLTRNAGGPDEDISEVVEQPKRPGLKIYRLASGHQLYTKSHLLKHFTIKAT